MKKKAFHPRHLDIEAFCKAGGTLSGDNALGEFERLQSAQDERSDHEPPPAGPVRWTVTGEWRTAQAGQRQPGAWLHLDAQAGVPQICQRCLQPMTTEVLVERSFRFVEDESLAAELDEGSEDDVLAISRNFDVLELIEDELLMDLPIVPMHDDCDMPDVGASPIEAAADADEDPAAPDRPNPFAVLQSLTGRVRKDDPEDAS